MMTFKYIIEVDSDCADMIHDIKIAKTIGNHFDKYTVDYGIKSMKVYRKKVRPKKVKHKLIADIQNKI